MKPLRSTIFERIASNAGILALGNFGAVLANYLAVTYLARGLGKEMFGLFAYGQTIAAYAILSADLGFSSYFSRTVAREPRFVEKKLVCIVTTQAGAGLAAIILLLLLSVVLSPSRSTRTIAVVLISASVGLLYPFVIDWYYLGTERIVVYSISKLIQAVTVLVGAVTFVATPQNILLACSLRTISLFFAACWLACRLPNSIPLEVATSLHGTWRTFKTSAKWFWMSAVLVQLYNGLDIIILQSLGRTLELGLYSASFRLNALMVTAISLMNSAMLPILASESLAASGRFRAVLKHYILLAAAVAVVLVTMAVFGSDVFVAVAYGSSYQQAGQYLHLLLLGSAALAINGAIAQPLLATGRERAVTFQVAITAVACVVANFIYIPKFGALAASWVYLGAGVLGTVWLLPAYRTLLRDGPTPRSRQSLHEVEELA